MRVIAGKYRSRSIASLPGLELRPTSDRLRETLFNVLTAGNPEALEGSVWVDLYAGTGAVSIEALSRGAQKVYFVESSAPRVELIRRNLRSLGIAAGFEIMQRSVARALPELAARAVIADFVFLDPPYSLEEAYPQTLQLLAQSILAKGKSIAIAEHPKKLDPGEVFGSLLRYRKLEQGDAALSFYRIA